MSGEVVSHSTEMLACRVGMLIEASAVIMFAYEAKRCGSPRDIGFIVFCSWLIIAMQLFGIVW